jgi:hypothetical protein
MSHKLSAGGSNLAVKILICNALGWMAHVYILQFMQDSVEMLVRCLEAISVHLLEKFEFSI